VADPPVTSKMSDFYNAASLVLPTLRAPPHYTMELYMKTNAVGWFDIYVDNMSRAQAFYETTLGLTLTPIVDPTGETQMMSFAGDMSAYGAGGALVKSNYARPGVGGTMVYFSVADCAVAQGRVGGAGGAVIRPKFSIGEFGFVSICQDTEGNVFGLNSMV
jgi:uncharacterized protein